MPGLEAATGRAPFGSSPDSARPGSRGRMLPTLPSMVTMPPWIGWPSGVRRRTRNCTGSSGPGRVTLPPGRLKGPRLGPRETGRSGSVNTMSVCPWPLAGSCSGRPLQIERSQPRMVKLPSAPTSLRPSSSGSTRPSGRRRLNRARRPAGLPWRSSRRPLTVKASPMRRLEGRPLRFSTRAGALKPAASTRTLPSPAAITCAPSSCSTRRLALPPVGVAAGRRRSTAAVAAPPSSSSGPNTRWPLMRTWVGTERRPLRAIRSASPGRSASGVAVTPSGTPTVSARLNTWAPLLLSSRVSV